MNHMWEASGHLVSNGSIHKYSMTEERKGERKEVRKDYREKRRG